MRFSPELILLIVISTILQMTVRSDPVLFEGRCAEDNGGCDQECISAAAAAGGYYCDCSIPGYQLLEDGITCQAVNFCEVLTPNPIDGVLNCRYTPSSNGWICFIVCDAGYFFVSGVNDYITCGIETDWKWSHQLVNDTAELPTCTREFFVDTKTVVRYDYILPEGGCSNHDLFDRYLHSTLQQGVEGMAACEGRCWAPSVVTSCQTDLPHTTLSVEVGVYFINGQQEAVGPDCGTRCRILNTRQILGETFRIITAVEDVVLSIGENVSSPTSPETPRVAPDSFIYEQPRLLCKEPGRVLTKKFFCVPCAPGSYLADPEDLHCTPCPVATYQLLEGQVSCSPCRPGSSTLTQGTVHPADCSVRLD